MKITEEKKKQLEQKLQQLNDLKARLFKAAKSSEPDLEQAQAADLVAAYPLVHAMLFAHLIEGGPEEGATILLWGKDDGLGGIFNIRSWGKRAFIDAGSLQEWLQQAEDLLANPDTKWQSESRRKRSTKKFSGKPK